MKYNTSFGTEKGPDVGYPIQVNQNFGAELQVYGEADPSYFSPLDTNKNILEQGINENTIWNQSFGGSMPSNTL
jgi:hypothetical protein